MKRMISVVVFVCLFSYPVIGQGGGNIDVDKEIDIVMKELVQRLEKIGLTKLRDNMIQDVKNLQSYYQGLHLAKQLNDKKLIQEINLFIRITELKIKSNLRLMRSLDIQFEDIEKQLRNLLEQKKRKERKNKRTVKRRFFTCFK